MVDRAGASPGGVPSNTPPQNRQTATARRVEAPDNALPGGDDWLEGVVYIRWDKERALALFNALDEAKEAARAEAEPKDGEAPRKGKRPKKRPPAFVMLPGSMGRWIVHPHTVRLGDKTKGPVVSWIVERDGVTFGIMRRLEPHATYPSAFYRFTGETLTSVGSSERAWAYVQEWIAELGGEIIDDALSRVDPCVDLPGQSVAPLVKAFRDRRVVSRVKRSKEEGFFEVFSTTTKDTGVRFGKGACLLRIYDKAEECRDLAKRSWIIARRWGGKDQDEALRAEFQLRTEFLRAAKNKIAEGKLLRRPVIRTAQDWFDHRAEMLDYLTSDWIRFVDGDGDDFDRRQTKRVEELPLWTQIREKFQQWAGVCDAERFYQPPPKEQINIEALSKQVRGCMLSAAALHHEDIDGPEDFLGFINETLWKIIETDPTLADEIKARRNDLCPVASDQVPF